MARQDLFTVVHKAIRAMIYDVGPKLQTADFTDGRITKENITQLEKILRMLREHSENEDRFVFAEVHRFDPGMVDVLKDEHRKIEKRLDLVNGVIGRMQSPATTEQKIETGDELNRRFNELVAFYLTHLYHEETTILPATWKYFTDEQLVVIRMNTEKTCTPGHYTEWLRWMFASMNNIDLANMFKGVKTSPSPHVFEGMAQIVRETLGQGRWLMIKQRAGL